MSSSNKRYLATVALFLLLIFGMALLGIVFQFRLDEKQAAFWDIFIKAVGGFVAIAGVLLTLTKYLDDKLSAQKKPFADLRGSIYAKLIQSTAMIGNYNSRSKEWRAAEKAFWVLFWGEVPLVADGKVSEAVDKFYFALADHAHNQVVLRNLSMDLARACRKSLGFDDLDPLHNRPAQKRVEALT